MPFAILFVLCASLMAGGAVYIHDHEKKNEQPTAYVYAEDLPIEFVLDKNADADWRAVTSSAAALWGKEHAYVRFGAPYSSEGGIVGIKFGKVYDKANDVLRYGETKTVARQSTIMYSTITMDPDTPEDVRVRYVAHEMGHALGLRDSSDPHSVMYAGTIVSGELVTAPFEVPEVPVLPKLQDPFGVPIE